MQLDYFYGGQAEQFSFYRIPKVLFTEERFRSLSMDAKVLYGLLLDRMGLSIRNGWTDKEGRIYIIFTTEQIMEALGCANQKVTKLLCELENKCGLIERKRQGLCKPNLIYVKNFVDNHARQPKSQDQNHENHDAGIMESTVQESRESHGIKTESNYTDLSDTYPISSSEEPLTDGWDEDGMGRRALYQNYFEKTLSVPQLIEESPDEEETIQGIVELLVDACCTKRKFIRVAGDDHPAEVVKGRFMKLEARHIRYVLKCLMENTTKVRNMKQYLLAALYNAPTTVSSYYQAWVNNDLAVRANE